jgi:hypothetical protein
MHRRYKINTEYVTLPDDEVFQNLGDKELYFIPTKEKWRLEPVERHKQQIFKPDAPEELGS